MALTMSRISREYVFFDVTTPNDLSQSDAEVAFVGEGVVPGDTDWREADLVETPAGGWSVRILVGPGSAESVELSPTAVPNGDYQAWVRITDEPERPVRRPGVVTIQ